MGVFRSNHPVHKVLAVSIGSTLDWYEIFLYLYWAPKISVLFFPDISGSASIDHGILIFGIGLLARPLGGVVFGRFGDRFGRRRALLLSLSMLTFPTVFTGLLPSYEQIGVLAPILLVLCRVLQSFPAGGELPGAMCYLYESAPLQKRRFFSSWTLFGPQFGIFLSSIECVLLEIFLTPEQVLSWGWRLSFVMGGILGLCGLCLRYYLHETHLFQEMEAAKHLPKTSLWQSFRGLWLIIGIGILYWVYESVTYYLISANIPIYLNQVLSFSYYKSIIISSFLILVITLLLPVFGILSEKYDQKKMLMYSMYASLLMVVPFGISLQYSIFWLLLVSLFFISIFCSCMTAVLPYLFCALFATRIRFTAIGLSFNIVNALTGGFVPFTTLSLYHFTGQKSSLCWVLLPAWIVSLWAYTLVPRKKTPSV